MQLRIYMARVPLTYPLLKFVAFMAMVSWGLLISLILMPVILSLWGPTVCTIGPRQNWPQFRQSASGSVVSENDGGTQVDKYYVSSDDGSDSGSDSDSGILETNIDFGSLVRKARKLPRWGPAWMYKQNYT